MNIGDLVKLKHDTAPYGFIIKIDKDHYGARQAYKIYDAPRGVGLHPKMINGIGPTKDGIRDRVLVDWIAHGQEYIDSNQLEVISESR